jgi:hypothetical protein
MPWVQKKWKSPKGKISLNQTKARNQPDSANCQTQIELQDVICNANCRCQLEWSARVALPCSNTCQHGRGTTTKSAASFHIAARCGTCWTEL